MISRLIVKYHGKVYSIPISHYTCEDVEHWGDHLRVKPYFPSHMKAVEALYSELLRSEYYDSNELIVSELFGRLYKLVHISKELYRDSIYKCFTVITLEQIEVPTPQDFPML